MITHIFSNNKNTIICELFFRPAEGPIPEGPTTLRVIGFSLLNPTPDEARDIAQAWIEVANVLELNSSQKEISQKEISQEEINQEG